MAGEVLEGDRGHPAREPSPLRDVVGDCVVEANVPGAGQFGEQQRGEYLGDGSDLAADVGISGVLASLRRRDGHNRIDVASTDQVLVGRVDPRGPRQGC